MRASVVILHAEREDYTCVKTTLMTPTRMDDTNQTAAKIQSVGKPFIALPWLNQMAKPRAQSFIFREGGLAELDSVLSQLSAHRVFFVADPVAYSASSAEVQIAGTFASRELLRFSEFEVNPKS